MSSNFGPRISDPAKKVLICFLAVTMIFCFPVPSAHANVLGNPTFSLPIGNGTAGNWDSTNGAYTTTPGSIGFDASPFGPNVLVIPGTPAGLFTFQSYRGAKPGDYVVFSAYAQTDLAGAGYGELRIEFQKVNSDGSTSLISDVLPNVFERITSGNAPIGGGYQFFSIAGIAPEGTQQVTFTIREQGGAVAGNLAIAQANGEVNPAKLVIAASKRNVAKGDVIGMNVHYKNGSDTQYQNVRLKIDLPNGIDYAKNSVQTNGVPADYQKGSIIVNPGNLSGGEDINVTFAALVTSGVQLGHSYSIDAELTGEAVVTDPLGGITTVYANGDLHDRVSVNLRVVGDPMFEEGTIIGKVFNDLNQDGVQQCGEKGVPWVKLYTEDGIAITTDENGMYHIPAVQPGRHLVKIDGHTLPEGTKFITEESYLVKITPGIMGKANFAVLLPPSKVPAEFQKDLMVMVTQGADISAPRLDIQMDPQVLKLGVGVLEKEPVFKLDSNYTHFVKKWAIEVRDSMGQEVWTGYGVGQPPPEVTWSGLTEAGLLIKPGIYSYQLKFRDAKHREDWTPLKFFEVYNKLDPRTQKNYEPEIPPLGDFNLFKDGQRSIPLIAKPTVRVQGKTKKGYEVKINDAPVTVDPATGMFQQEYFVEPGEHTFVVSATDPSGESTLYQEKIKVKDSTFFMVALGEEQLGLNFSNGAMEAADSPAYKDGFTETGKMAFFLKGKLKGKFLVKARYDTSDQSTDLFRNLDPNMYYPIYGDNSTRDYEARDTAQKLFILVEMDKSYVKWGSFKTAFTDTELATYNRTLSGLKVDFDTVSSTVYGDPKRGVKLFWAKSGKEADHNELFATGGTLYYTRNRNIIEGSEKLRVEVRDKIQGMVLSSYDLQEGTDYEIRYNEGRIMLSRPLSSVAATDTLASVDIMDGNPVVLVVDYEYDPGSVDLKEIPDSGIRGYTWIGDHFRVGATAVDEKRTGTKYNMRGVDGMLKVGRNTKITAEYATTNEPQMDSSVSFDGGLSFGELGAFTGEASKSNKTLEEAYIIKAESQPVKNLDVSGYIQDINPGFSNGHMGSQEGYKKFGLAAIYRFTQSFAARYRYDQSELSGRLKPFTQSDEEAPYQDFQSHTAQLIYDDGKYLAEAEYQHRDITQISTPENTLETLYSEMPYQNAITTKLGYHLNDRVLPYVKAQTTINTSRDYQLGGGVRCELIRDVFGYIEQMFGPLGDSTNFGFERQHGNGGRSYANLRSIDRGIGNKTLTTAIGNSFSLTEKSRIYSERQYSTYHGQDGFADILGYDGSLGDHWDYSGKFERRHLTSSMVRGMSTTAAEAQGRNNSYNTVAGALAYADGQKLRARTYWECRFDGHSPTTTQLVTMNSLKYQFHRDLSFLGWFNLGDSRYHNPGDTPAAYMEMTAGIAYRPIALDKFNVLAKYTFLQNISDDVQFDTDYYNGVQFDDLAHIIATDIMYDFNRWLGFAEKLAFKRSEMTVLGNTTAANSFLSVNRLNFHVTRKWDLIGEYRILWQSSALRTLRQGALFEVDREIYDYVRLGVGYNFTDFSDDLREANNYHNNGPFVRMTGKF